MKKLSMDKLVNTVINERKAKGLTQVQLAEATGINRAMIGRLENSDYIPSIDQLQRLGENLGFEVTDLFVEEEENHKDDKVDNPVSLYAATKKSNVTQKFATALNLFPLLTSIPTSLILIVGSTG